VSHGVRELVSEGRSHISAGTIGPDPDRP
jgi:hypothetical protein